MIPVGVIQTSRTCGAIDDCSNPQKAIDERVNRDKPDFATKQRMFGLLAIDGGPLLPMTAGPAVPQLLLV